MILPCDCPSPAHCIEATGGEQGLTADELEIVRLRRELGEAKAERDEARAKIEEAKRAALVGWWSVCAANTWGFDSRTDHVAALLCYGRDALAVLEGRS